MTDDPDSTGPADAILTEEDSVPKLSLKVLDARMRTLEGYIDERIDGLVDRVNATINGLKPQTEEVTAALHQATAEFIEIVEPGSGSLVEDLLIGIITALRCAKINTAARMSEELAAKYFDSDDFVEKRFPWMDEYK